MLQPVAVAHKHLSDYASIVGRSLVDEIRERAERLKGKRILHVSATAFGGGVSEILYTLVPLMVDVGLEAEWHVIYGREEFFNATKVMHNALQGNPRTSPTSSGRPGSATTRSTPASCPRAGTCASSTTRSRRRCARSSPRRRATGCGAATSTSRRRTRPRSSGWCRSSTPIPRPCSTCSSTFPRGSTAGRTSSRRRSTRWRRRTWRSPPRTPSTSASSSGSTSIGRCSARSRGSTRGRIRSG